MLYFDLRCSLIFSIKPVFHWANFFRAKGSFSKSRMLSFIPTGATFSPGPFLSAKSEFEHFLQGVPENLCPVCLKIATKRQKVLTILLLDVALQMFN